MAAQIRFTPQWAVHRGVTCCRACLQDHLAKSQLGRSGFPAAFSLIFLSEIGDKTFFIAALLAAKFGRWLSFSASLLSLSVMTIVSVAIGQSFRHVPEFLKSGLPIGEWASVALLVYFGIRTIKVLHTLHSAGHVSRLVPLLTWRYVQSAKFGVCHRGHCDAFNVLHASMLLHMQDAWDTPEGEGGGELEGAKDSIDSAEASGRISGTTTWQAFVQVATLIFLAEWGDRSMLATIVLAVSQSPVGRSFAASGAVQSD